MNHWKLIIGKVYSYYLFVYPCHYNLPVDTIFNFLNNYFKQTSNILGGFFLLLSICHPKLSIICLDSLQIYLHHLYSYSGSGLFHASCQVWIFLHYIRYGFDISELYELWHKE